MGSKDKFWYRDPDDPHECDWMCIIHFLNTPSAIRMGPRKLRRKVDSFHYTISRTSITDIRLMGSFRCSRTAS